MDAEQWKQLIARLDRFEAHLMSVLQEHSAFRVRLEGAERKASDAARKADDASEHATKARGAREWLHTAAVVLALATSLVSLGVVKLKKETRHERARAPSNAD